MLLCCEDSAEGWKLGIPLTNELSLGKMCELVEASHPRHPEPTHQNFVVCGRILPKVVGTELVAALLESLDQYCDPSDKRSLRVRVLLRGPHTAVTLQSGRKAHKTVVSEEKDGGSGYGEGDSDVNADVGPGDKEGGPLLDESSLSAAKKWLAKRSLLPQSPEVAQLESVLSYAQRVAFESKLGIGGIDECASVNERALGDDSESQRREDIAVPGDIGGVNGGDGGGGDYNEQAVVAARPPEPRWLDHALLFRIGIGLLLFYQGMPMSGPQTAVILGGSIFYYLVETGIIRWVYHNCVATSGENILPRHPALGYAVALISLSVGVPTRPGLITDVLSFFGAFWMSLIPTWDPRGREN